MSLRGTFLFVVKLFISSCIHSSSTCFGFEIHRTTFKWSSLQGKFLINAELSDHAVILNKCQFILIDQSKLLPDSTLVLFENYWDITVTNTLFNAQEALANNQFNIMTMKEGYGDIFTNTTVLCPTNMKASETSNLQEQTRSLTCKGACLTEHYTFEAGTMTIDGESFDYD